MYPQLKRRGGNVILWTPAEKSEFEWLWDCYGASIDGVISDKPAALKEWRQTQGQNLLSIIQLGASSGDNETEEFSIIIL